MILAFFCGFNFTSWCYIIHFMYSEVLMYRISLSCNILISATADHLTLSTDTFSPPLIVTFAHFCRPNYIDKCSENTRLTAFTWDSISFCEISIYWDHPCIVNGLPLCGPSCTTCSPSLVWQQVVLVSLQTIMLWVNLDICLSCCRLNIQYVECKTSLNRECSCCSASVDRYNNGWRE